MCDITSDVRLNRIRKATEGNITKPKRRYRIVEMLYNNFNSVTNDNSEIE